MFEKKTVSFDVVHACQSSVGATWGQPGNSVGSSVGTAWAQLCEQRGGSLGAALEQRGSSMGATWGQCGSSAGAAWETRGSSMGTAWEQRGDRVGTAWGQRGGSVGAVVAAAQKGEGVAGGGEGSGQDRDPIGSATVAQIGVGAVWETRGSRLGTAWGQRGHSLRPAWGLHGHSFPICVAPAAFPIGVAWAAVSDRFRPGRGCSSISGSLDSWREWQTKGRGVGKTRSPIG